MPSHRHLHFSAGTLRPHVPPLQPELVKTHPRALIFAPRPRAMRIRSLCHPFPHRELRGVWHTARDSVPMFPSSTWCTRVRSESLMHRPKYEKMDRYCGNAACGKQIGKKSRRVGACRFDTYCDRCAPIDPSIVRSANYPNCLAQPAHRQQSISSMGSANGTTPSPIAVWLRWWALLASTWKSWRTSPSLEAHGVCGAPFPLAGAHWSSFESGSGRSIHGMYN
ncbi:hypothetical protein HGRIS_004357 [Hohenbuehelia grisea]|uniref:Uncharacterized protein n=1 Tax=Hohenbuehelia grisea TaxID=104357 RepID=A0ABR3JBQ7_9AGAR